MLKTAFSSFKLTNSQSEVIEKLEAFLQSPEHFVFLLKGYAGTGKTFLMKGLVQYLKQQNRNVCLLAPTGKAARVLGQKTDNEAYTIHSMLYNFDQLVEFHDENKPDTFRFYANLHNNDYPSNTVYIIDESSMISDIYSDSEFILFGSGFLLEDLFKFINLDQNEHGKKIIFIGDSAQLPPIGMKFSPALSSQYLQETYQVSTQEYELTEVVRQKASSGVLFNAGKLRESLQKNEFNQISIQFNEIDIHKINTEQMIPIYLNACHHQINDKAIIITYSNQEVLDYNLAIREYFFPNDKESIATGEKVMVVKNQQIDNNIKLHNGDFVFIRKIYGNSEKRTIPLKSKNKETIPIELSFRRVNAGFRKENNAVIFTDLFILENLLFSPNRAITSDEQKALYIDFCIRNSDITYNNNRDEFKVRLKNDPYFNALQIKFGYAITCHKAQGSEWETVLIQCKTHSQVLSQDYFRWLYTALTRTSNQVYLLNAPKIGLGSGLKIVGKNIHTLPENHQKMENQEKNIVNSIQLDHELPKIHKTHTININVLRELSQMIYHKVLPIAQRHQAKIQTIESKQFQDIYSFNINNLIQKIGIHYNTKNCISSITPLSVSELSFNLIHDLNQLKNQMLFIQKEVAQSLEPLFNEDFLNQFHEIISLKMQQNEIQIGNIANIQYGIRYQFNQGQQFALLNIYYNGKKQFTKIQVIKYSSNEFKQLIESILEGV